MKKAQGFVWSTIGKAILILIAIGVIAWLFGKYIGREKGTIEEGISGVEGDLDKDGVRDIFDRCCCTDKYGDVSDVDISGCSFNDKEISCSERKDKC